MEFLAVYTIILIAVMTGMAMSLRGEIREVMRMVIDIKVDTARIIRERKKEE